VDDPADDIVPTTPLTVDVTVQSGEELVWQAGAAHLGEGALQHEVLTPSLVWGNYIKGSIHGFKFEDVDGDGVRDEGEGPMAGVTFELVDVAGTVSEQVTNADGEFWFVGLAPGAYTVREVDDPNDNFDPTTPLARDLVVRSGEELVWQAGAAMLPEGALQHEVVVGVNLMWGNQEQDFEGCTPGFWKSSAANAERNPDKFADENGVPLAWVATGVLPSDPLSSVGFDGFTVEQGDATTFEDALNAGGGGQFALMRHAAAAYLNAAHPDINYPLSTTEVVDMVNAALLAGGNEIEDLKDLLDFYNNSGCSIDQFGRTSDEAAPGPVSKSDLRSAVAAVAAFGVSETETALGTTTKSSARAARDAAFSSLAASPKRLLPLQTQAAWSRADEDISSLPDASTADDVDDSFELATDKVFALLGAGSSEF
jgi:hypothetical protein